MTDDAWIKAEREHERQMAEIAASERHTQRLARTERVTTITVGVTAVVIVGLLSFLAWRVYVASAENNTERDRACYEAGGTRTQIGTGPVLCLHISEVEPG